MEQLANIILTHKKEDRTYQFIMPVGAPFGEAYDAAFASLNAITAMAKEAVDKQKREEEKEEMVKPELVQ